jgi:diketogulonate reductase-like aldo/keto reductase
MSKRRWSRRELAKLSLALGLTPILARGEDESMIEREIPSSGEKLPVIGLGTYSVFDVASTAENVAARAEIVDLLTGRGGSVIDSSPMYKRSEQIVGDIVRLRDNRDDLFIATKVWTDGKEAGERQMAESARLMQADVIDLMQVHNLRDLDTQLGTIRDWQDEKRIRYNGVTHYNRSAHAELVRVMTTHKPQFIQINYSLTERGAEQDVLPVARDLGIAVIINRPFVAGSLFAAVRDRELPDWAREYADSWGQFFLKFVIGHPAVTCAIPATSKPHHMADNLGAGFGPLPDEAMRRRMVPFVESL